MSFNGKMNSIVLLIVAMIVSGCFVTVNERYTYHAPHTPTCHMINVPVYGYADIYRNSYSTVRIIETAYVDRQMRCY